MRNKIIIVGAIAVIIYVLGARSHRPVSGKQPESLRHQAERLWKDPKSVKARRKLRKKVARAASDQMKRIRDAR